MAAMLKVDAGGNESDQNPVGGMSFPQIVVKGKGIKLPKKCP